MVYFLNIKGKTHAEDTLQSLFDENKEKMYFRLQYSIEEMSPIQTLPPSKHKIRKKK